MNTQLFLACRKSESVMNKVSYMKFHAKNILQNASCKKDNAKIVK